MPRDVSRYHGQAILDCSCDLSASSPSYYIGLAKRQAVVRGNEENRRPFGCHDSGQLDIIGVIADKPSAYHPAHSHRGFYLATVNWSAIH